MFSVALCCFPRYGINYRTVCYLNKFDFPAVCDLGRVKTALADVKSNMEAIHECLNYFGRLLDVLFVSGSKPKL